MSLPWPTRPFLDWRIHDTLRSTSYRSGLRRRGRMGRAWRSESPAKQASAPKVICVSPAPAGGEPYLGSPHWLLETGEIYDPGTRP
jgi:hypothetical protein